MKAHMGFEGSPGEIFLPALIASRTILDTYGERWPRNRTQHRENDQG